MDLKDVNMKELSGLEKVKVLSYFFAKVILYVIIFMFATVYALTCIYFGNVLHNLNNNEDRPTLFNAYVIVSGSMIPGINIQDGVVIKREKMKDLKEGDIITFTTHDSRYDGYTVTHRIIDIKNKNHKYYFRTKGDNNKIEDPYLVKEEDIYGKVFLTIPKIGYIKNMLLQSIGWIIFVILPALALVVYDVHKLVVHIHNTTKQEEELEII